MKPEHREENLRAARLVSELAAEVRREEGNAPARRASLDKWKRKADEPARVHHANGLLALRCWIEACGYDFELSYPVLSAALASGGGADHPVTRPDWMMGFYLRGGSPEEFARVEALPPKSNEKRKLAVAWKRAYDAFMVEQERVGLVSLRREHGTMRAGRRQASKVHALLAQDLAEMERSPERRGRRRFEGFAAAARAQVELVRRDPSRFAQATPKGEPKPRQPEPEKPAASRRAVFLAKLSKMTAELLKAEVAGGATDAELDELRSAAHAQLEELFADALPPADGPETEPSVCTSVIEKSGTQNGQAEPESVAPLSEPAAQNSPENCESFPRQVHKTVTRGDAEEAPDENDVRERIGVLVESGVLGEADAREWEEVAHDSSVRLAFARRFMWGVP